MWRVSKAQERSLDLIPEEIESNYKLLEQGSDTRQVMFAKELVWLKCAKQMEGRKSLETGRPV